MVRFGIRSILRLGSSEYGFVTEILLAHSWAQLLSGECEQFPRHSKKEWGWGWSLLIGYPRSHVVLLDQHWGWTGPEFRYNLKLTLPRSVTGSNPYQSVYFSSQNIQSIRVRIRDGELEDKSSYDELVQADDDEDAKYAFSLDRPGPS